RGPLRFTAARAVVTPAADAARFAACELLDGVTLEGPDIKATGARLRFDGRGRRRALLEGRPLRAELGGAFLPGRLRDAGTRTTLVSRGPITVEPSDDAFPGATDVLKIHAAAGVTIEAGAESLDAGDATLWSGEIAGKRRALKAYLAQGVKGVADDADLEAQEATFERDHAPDGAVRTETLVLKTDYVVRYRGEAFLGRGDPPAAGDVGAQSRPRDAQAVLTRLRGADRLTVQGAERFEASRSPTDDAPSLVSLRGPSEVRLETAATGALAARLESRRASLVLAPERDAEGRLRRRVHTLSAEQRAVLELPGLGRARGAVLRLKPAEGEVVLEAGREPTPATVEVFSTPGARADEFTAARFVWHAGLRRLTADGRVRADVTAPRLPWLSDAGPNEPRRTETEAGRVVVHFDDDDGRGKVRELNAEGGVEVRQDGRTLRCDTAYFDLPNRTATAAGAPVLYAARTTAPGAPPAEDRLETPRAAWFGDQVTLEGPVKARLHVASPRSALRLGARPPAKAPARSAPVEILCSGLAVLKDGVLQLSGGVTASQEDPARDGFSARCDEASFFFAAEGGGHEVVLAAMQGRVVFRSAAAEASGDVLKLDRLAKTLTLYNVRPEPVLLRLEDAGGVVTNAFDHVQVDFSGPRPTMIQRGAGLRVDPARPESR
ncbi:MAG TPA: hypothetical protein VEI02_03225, partial [Planctomycetota bacterium]|nr:hypothetical protein [Planctomycetota bacterium]